MQSQRKHFFFLWNEKWSDKWTSWQNLFKKRQLFCSIVSGKNKRDFNQKCCFGVKDKTMKPTELKKGVRVFLYFFLLSLVESFSQTTSFNATKSISSRNLYIKISFDPYILIELSKMVQWVDNTVRPRY